jgi:hypothetical protein
MALLHPTEADKAYLMKQRKNRQVLRRGGGLVCQ